MSGLSTSTVYRIKPLFTSSWPSRWRPLGSGHSQITRITCIRKSSDWRVILRRDCFWAIKIFWRKIAVLPQHTVHHFIIFLSQLLSVRITDQKYWRSVCQLGLAEPVSVVEPTDVVLYKTVSRLQIWLDPCRQRQDKLTKVWTLLNRLIGTMGCWNQTATFVWKLILTKARLQKNHLEIVRHAKHLQKPSPLSLISGTPETFSILDRTRVLT